MYIHTQASKWPLQTLFYVVLMSLISSQSEKSRSVEGLKAGSRLLARIRDRKSGVLWSFLANSYKQHVLESNRSKINGFWKKKFWPFLALEGTPRGYPVSQLLDRNSKIPSVAPVRVTTWPTIQKISLLASSVLSNEIRGSKKALLIFYSKNFCK